MASDMEAVCPICGGLMTGMWDEGEFNLKCHFCGTLYEKVKWGTYLDMSYQTVYGNRFTRDKDGYVRVQDRSYGIIKTDDHNDNVYRKLSPNDKISKICLPKGNFSYETIFEKGSPIHIIATESALKRYPFNRFKFVLHETTSDGDVFVLVPRGELLGMVKSATQMIEEWQHQDSSEDYEKFISMCGQISISPFSGMGDLPFVEETYVESVRSMEDQARLLSEYASFRMSRWRDCEAEDKKSGYYHELRILLTTVPDDYVYTPTGGQWSKVPILG